jgi:hypothetical protein
MQETNTINELAPLNLTDAISMCSHFQYLVDNYYDTSNPGLGSIDALIIHTHGKREEVMAEYKTGKIKNAGIYKSQFHRREEYDILLVARLNHPQLKSQFEIFKDIRSYIVEQSISFPVVVVA